MKSLIISQDFITNLITSPTKNHIQKNVINNVTSLRNKLTKNQTKLTTNPTPNFSTNFTPIKNLILSFFFGMILLIGNSCKKINQDNFSSGFTSHQNINNFIQNFNIKKFNDQFGQNLKLDFKNSTPVELVYLGLPENYIQTPIWDENSKKYGTMYSLKINDSNYSSLVMSQNNFNLKNGNGVISFTGLGINNSVEFFLENNKIKNVVNAEQGSTNIKSNSISANTSNCTTLCYKKAKDACDADPDCKFLCDNLPSCSGSIAVACFMHCMFK